MVSNVFHKKNYRSEGADWICMNKYLNKVYFWARDVNFATNVMSNTISAAFLKNSRFKKQCTLHNVQEYVQCIGLKKLFPLRLES